MRLSLNHLVNNPEDLCAAPGLFYGTHSNAMYCPVRDTTVVEIQANYIYLQWTLLSAEILLMGTKAQEDISVLSRRTHLYRYMSQMVTNPATRYSDSTILGIASGGVVETRLGDLSKAQKHLVAAKHLIEARGDFQANCLSSVATFNIWFGQDVGAFSDFRALESAISSFTKSILAIQEWRQSLPGNIRPRSQGDSQAPLAQYLASHYRAFHVHSPLRRFVESDFPDRDRSQQRSHIAILWILNKSLSELRYRYKESTKFLDTLYRYVESGDSPTSASTEGGKTRRRPTIKARTVVYILADCASKFDKELILLGHNANSASGREDGDRCDLPWWEAIDVLALLHLVSEARREKVLRLLSEWLIGTEAGKAPVLTRRELDEIADEMMMGWLVERSGS